MSWLRTCMVSLTLYNYIFMFHVFPEKTRLTMQMNLHE